MSHTFFPPPEFAGRGFIELPMSGAIQWLPGHAEELHKYVEIQGRPFILVGRNSTVAGSAGYRAAATDLHQAAEVLSIIGGMDVRQLLPSIDDLTVMLRTNASIETHVSSDGKSFVNKFIFVHVAGTPLVLSVSVGTGKKVSDELEQPHTVRLERYVRDFSPRVAGMFAKRTDRYCRTIHGHTRVYDRLAQLDREQGVWAGDGQIGRWEFDKPHTSMVLAMLASFGATEAEVTAAKTLSAKRGLTGERMEGGRVMMATACPAPAGTMYFRDVASGRFFLAIDTPSNYPAPHEATGLPQVRTSYGEPADQVALVRRLIAMWGVDDTDPIHVFVDLCRDGLSSHRLRGRHGLDCAFLSDRHKRKGADAHIAKTWAHTMRKNLDFYETGVLRVSLGGEVRLIENCFPGDGPWGSPEDFARIRAYEARRENKSAAIRRNRWSSSGWQGLPVVLDGQKASLRGVERTASAAQRRGEGNDWHVDRAGRRKREFTPYVPDTVLRDSVIVALRRHDGHLLERFAMDRASVEVANLKLRAAEVRTQLAVLEAGRRTIVDDLMVVEDLSKSLLTELSRRDAQMAREQAALLAEQGTISVQLAVLRQQVGATRSDLEKIVAFLKGHNEPGISDAWRRAIQDLEFTSAGGTDSRRQVSWTGDLVIDDERAERSLWRIPFSGSYDPQAVEQEGGVLALLDRLRRGEVVRGVEGKMATLRKDLAALAGTKQSVLRAVTCNEPQLVRLWAAVQLPDPLPGEDPSRVISIEDLLADEEFIGSFGGHDPARALVARVQALAERVDEGGWLRPATRLGVEAVIRNARITAGLEPRQRPTPSLDTRWLDNLRGSARSGGQLHRWTFEARMWPVLTPCTFCGGVWCVPMRIQEVTGYLCLDADCRRDEAGVAWPTHFDQYICGTDLLLDAGRNLNLDDDFDADSRHLRNRTALTAATLVARRRTIDELTAEERVDLICSYRDENEPVRQLFDRLCIKYDHAYAFLDAKGIPRRMRRSGVRRNDHRRAGPRTRRGTDPGQSIAS